MNDQSCKPASVLVTRLNFLTTNYKNIESKLYILQTMTYNIES